MTVVKQNHGIAVPLSAWGHLRPCLQMLLNLLALHPSLHVSLVLAPSSVPRVQSELASASLGHLYTPHGSGTASPDLTSAGQVAAGGPGGAAGRTTASVLGRLQLMACSSFTKNNQEMEYDLDGVAREAEDFAKTLPTFVTALLKGEAAIKYASSGGESVEHENRFAHIKPDFLVFDAIRGFLVEPVKKICKELWIPPIPLLAFLPFNATATYHYWASEEEGGLFAQMIASAEAQIAKGQDAAQAYEDAVYPSLGKVVALPGLAKRYDYEWFPLFGTIPTLADVLREFSKSYLPILGKDVAALMLPFTAEAEPEATLKLEERLGKPVLMVGPQFSDEIWNGKKPERAPVGTASTDDERVLDFLDRMKEKHGAKTVCYVSLGSLFYPLLRPKLVAHLLNTLHAAGIPFIFAHASGMATATALSEGLTDGLADHEDTCVVKFAPQWQVLNHEATGFFVTHCGSNSSVEAIMTELPIVTLPFAADQGHYATLLTERFRVGLDLIQAKTFKPAPSGEMPKKLYDGTIIDGTDEAIIAEMTKMWERIKGSEGDEMRERMRDLKGLLGASWEGGKARKAMEWVETLF